ncbi:MAG TPA: putative sulfate exporter family transporter, partial [Thermoanaerobaculia bacterium]
LAAVVPLLAYLHAKRSGRSAGRVRVASLLPLFVLGFLAMAVARSGGDAMLAKGSLAFGVWDRASWAALTKTLGETWAGFALATAMAAVGLGTRFEVFRGLGARPLYVGAVSAATVSALALALAALVGPLLP